MVRITEGHEKLRTLATVALVLDVLAALGVFGYGIYALATGNTGIGLGCWAAAVAAVLFGLFLYCQVLLLNKFVSYSYRSYETLLAAAELQRRQEEHTRVIAENSNLSEWAKRIVYRKKDFDFLRDTIHGAIVRQDWESVEHLIRDVDTEFGYHDEAARFREQLEQARKATSAERITAVLARFDKLCDAKKWDQAREDCERLHMLFPDDERIAALPQEIERRRQEVKKQLLKEYDQAVRDQDVDRAHRLLFALDQYIEPKEAEALKESARGVFRARLEQVKTRFSIAVSYKQFNNAIAAGEQVMREFPNSGYAQEIAKLMPVLRERAKSQKAHATPVTRSGTA
ncbi:MAG: hypothetical protein KAY37_15370 [Phycisphaerae bacterium]|nr:hypothetical protein [Phycisphaerae bacterium]